MGHGSWALVRERSRGLVRELHLVYAELWVARFQCIPGCHSVQTTKKLASQHAGFHLGPGKPWLESAQERRTVLIHEASSCFILSLSLSLALALDYGKIRKKKEGQRYRERKREREQKRERERERETETETERRERARETRGMDRERRREEAGRREEEERDRQPDR